MSAVVLDHQDPQAVFFLPVVDGVRELPHQAATDVVIDHRPAVGRGFDPGHRRIELAQEPFSQTRDALLAKPYGVQKFLFGIRW